MPSEKYAARRGSVEDGMRMITAWFARAPQGCTSRIYMHFLLIFQKVRPISKTRNQLYSLQLPLDQSAQQKHTLSRNQPPHSPTGHALHQAPPLCLTAQCQATAAYPATPTDNRMSLLWFLTVF